MADERIITAVRLAQILRMTPTELLQLTPTEVAALSRQGYSDG